MRHLGLGTQLAMMMVIGVIGGNWLDEKTGWDPLFVLSGSALGITAGIWAVYKEVSGTKR
jgi:F0F1-type ATP synthase assembly protein I